MSKLAQLPDAPWYKDGLKFTCTQCGKCCTGPSGFVWITEEEMHAMAKALRMTVQAFKIRYTRKRNNRLALVEKKNSAGTYDCIFLSEQKCQIYQARPRQCRTFPWWKENLNTEESWQLASLGCEGMHAEASLVPYSEIAQSLADQS